MNLKSEYSNFRFYSIWINSMHFILSSIIRPETIKYENHLIKSVSFDKWFGYVKENCMRFVL